MSGLQDIDPDDLRIGVAIARNDGELVPLTEAVLADALRHVAKNSECPELLTALADALDNPSAPTRLKLVRGRRGAPRGPQVTASALGLAYEVRKAVNAGVKQEAVIADVCRQWGMNRSTVMKHLKAGRSLLPLFDEMPTLRKDVQPKKRQTEIQSD